MSASTGGHRRTTTTTTIRSASPSAAIIHPVPVPVPEKTREEASNEKAGDGTAGSADPPLDMSKSPEVVTPADALRIASAEGQVAGPLSISLPLSDGELSIGEQGSPVTPQQQVVRDAPDASTPDEADSSAAEVQKPVTPTRMSIWGVPALLASWLSVGLGLRDRPRSSSLSNDGDTPEPSGATISASNSNSNSEAGEQSRDSSSLYVDAREQWGDASDEAPSSSGEIGCPTVAADASGEAAQPSHCSKSPAVPSSTGKAAVMPLVQSDEMPSASSSSSPPVSLLATPPRPAAHVAGEAPPRKKEVRSRNFTDDSAIAFSIATDGDTKHSVGAEVGSCDNVRHENVKPASRDSGDCAPSLAAAQTPYLQPPSSPHAKRIPLQPLQTAKRHDPYRHDVANANQASGEDDDASPLPRTNVFTYSSFDAHSPGTGPVSSTLDMSIGLSTMRDGDARLARKPRRRFSDSDSSDDGGEGGLASLRDDHRCDARPTAKPPGFFRRRSSTSSTGQQGPRASTGLGGGTTSPTTLQSGLQWTHGESHADTTPTLERSSSRLSGRFSSMSHHSMRGLKGLFSKSSKAPSRPPDRPAKAPTPAHSLSSQSSRDSIRRSASAGNATLSEQEQEHVPGLGGTDQRSASMPLRLQDAHGDRNHKHLSIPSRSRSLRSSSGITNASNLSPVAEASASSSTVNGAAKSDGLELVHNSALSMTRAAEPAST
ncbi:hypothetical protein KEM52_006744 [Ascosphaera acerosa]|nr:hypothetical protein KEM52_006744 [Ascosphaera acerosa]